MLGVHVEFGGRTGLQPFSLAEDATSLFCSSHLSTGYSHLFVVEEQEFQYEMLS